MFRNWCSAIPFVILVFLLAILPPADLSARAAPAKAVFGVEEPRGEEVVTAEPTGVEALLSAHSPPSTIAVGTATNSPTSADIAWIVAIAIVAVVSAVVAATVIQSERIQKEEQARAAERILRFAERRNKQPSEISADLSDKVKVVVKEREKQGQAEAEGRLTIKNFPPQTPQLYAESSGPNATVQESTMEITTELEASGNVLCTDGESQVATSVEVPAQLRPDPTQGIAEGDLVTVSVQLDIAKLQLLGSEIVNSALQSTTASVELILQLEQAGVMQEFSFGVSSENNVLQPPSGNIGLGTFVTTTGEIPAPRAANTLTISDSLLAGESITVDTTPIGGGRVEVREGIDFVAGSGAEQIALDIATALNASGLFSPTLLAGALDGVVYVDAAEGGSDKNQVLTSASHPNLVWGTPTLVAGIDGPVFGTTFNLPPQTTTVEFQDVVVGVPFTLTNMIQVDGSGADSASSPVPYVSCPSSFTTHLSAFTAESTAGAVTLRWETASEVDLAGFHLYRTPVAGGDAIRITDSLIPAGGSAEVGADYQVLDHPGPGGFVYELEWVSHDGQTLRQGQVEVEVGPDQAREGRLHLPLLTSGR